LLLLDIWPLKRFHSRHPWQGLVIEKLPLLILALLAGITVFLVQLKSGVLHNLNPFPLGIRIENTVVSYITYLVQMLWPVNLAVFYPHPLDTLPLWQILGSSLLLILITLICLKYIRQAPYLISGWLWYLGTLVPVIGLVQVGVQARADRYTYIPLIGIFIMVTWGISDILEKRRFRKEILTSLAALTLVVCCILTWSQIGTWKDKATLYAHAIKVIHRNYWAYNNYGAAIASDGHIDEAMTYFSKSLEIMPLYPGANKNMAVALIKKDRYTEALPYMQKALQMQPRNPEYLYITGLVLLKTGNVADAISYFQEALKINPADPNAREGLQEALTYKKKTD
ncbi:MAG: tetratricopeptide repeat protein, partial [Syntrophales bacterium]|nr:tetratricopeptide repeat protein [Syntrophales bacterium]